jgi:hypothetical protein
LWISMKKTNKKCLELAVPFWHTWITQAEKIDIERIQKVAAYIILGNDYVSYCDALKCLGLDSLIDGKIMLKVCH